MGNMMTVAAAAVEDAICGPMADDDLIVDLAEKQIGPFDPQVRLHCPLKQFALRQAKHCIQCHYFGGVRQRLIVGRNNPEVAQDAVKRFMVQCKFPITRRLIFLPEG